MKRKFLPCSLLCMFLAATTAFGNPGDTFYEANLSPDARGTAGEGGGL